MSGDIECILVWPDGRRDERFGPCCLHWLVPQVDRETGRQWHHTFTIVSGTLDKEANSVEFHHEKAEDVTAWSRENHERTQNKFWRMRGIRRPVMDMELKGFLPGETPEEQKRRVAIILSGEE